MSNQQPATSSQTPKSESRSNDKKPPTQMPRKTSPRKQKISYPPAICSSLDDDVELLAPEIASDIVEYHVTVTIVFLSNDVICRSRRLVMAHVFGRNMFGLTGMECTWPISGACCNTAINALSATRLSPAVPNTWVITRGKKLEGF